MTELKGALDPTRPPASGRVSRAILIFFILGTVGLALIWIERAPLLRAAGRAWVVSDRLEPADAAAVLGGDTDTRASAAAQLFKDGRVRQILVSRAGAGGDAGNPDREQLLKLGIPPAAIAEFADAPKNTYEEARALAQWAKQNQAQRIIVPTEIFPSRRVAWILRRELGKVGVIVMIEALAPSAYDLNDWWQNKCGITDFQTEAIKYLYYRLTYWRS